MDCSFIAGHRKEADGKEFPLWEFKHTLDELHNLNRINPFVFETQYMQNPTPIEGLMYGTFKTYREIPYTNRAIRKIIPIPQIRAVTDYVP